MKVFAVQYISHGVCGGLYSEVEVFDTKDKAVSFVLSRIGTDGAYKRNGDRWFYSAGDSSYEIFVTEVQ